MLGRFLIIVLGMLVTAGNVTANSSGLKSLQAEARADGDGLLELKHLHDLTKHSDSVTLSDKSIVGDKSFRFELNNGDCGYEPNWSDCDNERERTELYYVDDTFKKERWYRFYIFVPKDFNSVVPAKTSLIQFSTPNPFQTVVMFQYHKGGLFFNMNGMTFMGDPWYRLKSDEDLRGQWTEILFNTNWHPDYKKGYFKIWIDGEIKVDYKGRANHLKGKIVSLRYGIYNSFLNRYRRSTGNTTYPQRVVYFDGVRGDTSCKKLLKDRARCNKLLSQTLNHLQDTKDWNHKIYGDWNK